jgi:hypothetical protein
LFREAFINLFDNKCDFLGSFPQEKQLLHFNKSNAQKRIDEQYYKSNSVIPYSKINIEYLSKILDLCKTHQIKVIALTTPQQKVYQSMIPDQYIEMYSSFVKEHHLSIFNFEGLTLPDSCYLPDGDHVNYFGAVMVTEYFRKYLTLEKLQ